MPFNKRKFIWKFVCISQSGRNIVSCCCQGLQSVSALHVPFHFPYSNMRLTCLTLSYSHSLDWYSLITSMLSKSTYTLVSRSRNRTLSSLMKNLSSRRSLSGITRILHDSMVIPLSASSSSYRITSSKNNIGSGRFNKSIGICLVVSSNCRLLGWTVPL